MDRPVRDIVLSLSRGNPQSPEERWYKKYGPKSRAFSDRTSVTVSGGYFSLYVQKTHHLAQVKIRTVAISQSPPKIIPSTLIESGYAPKGTEAQVELNQAIGS
jgi:hypothetical protein